MDIFSPPRACDGTQIRDLLPDRQEVCHADGVGAEVVVVDQHRRAIPLGAGVLEVAHQFSLFGSHAKHRKAATLEAPPQ
jgi:hypothetical protein